MDGLARGQLLGDPLRQVDGDGEADAFITAAVGRNGRVDADDLAVEVHERAAAVAGIDGRVSLDEVLSLVDADAAPLGADDAGGHGAFQPEGIAQREDPIAYFHLVAVTQLGGSEMVGAIDAEHGEVGFGVGVDHRGLELAAVVQADGDVLAVADDVVVRQDQPGGIDDDARSEASLPMPRLAGHFLEEFPQLRHVAEGRAELAERVVFARRGAFELDGRGRFALDHDYRGLHGLDHLAEVLRQRPRGGRGLVLGDIAGGVII